MIINFKSYENSKIQQKYLFPVKLKDIKDYISYFKEIGVDIKFYEFSEKFIHQSHLMVGDIFIFFKDFDEKSENHKVPNCFKNRSYLVSNRTINKFVSKEIEDIDLYIDAKKYNL